MRNITDQNNLSLDLLLVIWSTLGFGGLLYGFSSAGNLGRTHPSVYLTIIISLVILFLFIQRQFKLNTPLLEFLNIKIFQYQCFLYL